MKNKFMLVLSICLCSIAIITLYFHNCHPVLKLRKNKKTIVIDVGHGGSDPGKVSINGIKEKDINLEIALYLKDYLIAQDYVVYLTRENDCGLYDPGASNRKASDLNNRIHFFNDKQAACVVSIHQNSYPDSIQHGAQTFYYANSTESKMLAESIQNSLLQMDTENTRKAKANDSYYLLKNSNMPAVIVECGFLSNPTETSKLTDPYYQKQLANAICLGICRNIK